MNGLNILDTAGEGYRRLVSGAKWTLATLNYAARFDAANIVELERHHLTDETFVLMTGQATLLTAPDEPGEARITRTTMEPLKYYNIGAGVWHNICVSRDARVLVAENANTSKDNTEYRDIKTGRVYPKLPEFEEVLPETYLLRVPFGPVWTGIILIRGERNVLIDSSHLEPERYLIPALARLGLKPSDITWLLNTHVHGDHIGGHHALVTTYGLKPVTLKSAAEALRDPVKVAIRVRTRFPKNSPAPQSYLKGVEPFQLLEPGQLLDGRFSVLETPGHDDDCLTWIDHKTGTAFTGDSLQANGTPTQGIGFYRSLAKYRRSLETLSAEPLQNIVCGHFYDGIGDVIRGPQAVQTALAFCAAQPKIYAERLAAYVGDKKVNPDDEAVLVPLARKLIGEVGCGTPESLFLAMHTISEHLKEMA